MALVDFYNPEIIALENLSSFIIAFGKWICLGPYSVILEHPH